MSVAWREDSLPVDDKKKIDSICLRFEGDWLAGRRPVMEPYLNQLHPVAQPALFRELLLLELDYRRALREELRADDYLQRFPGMENVIRTVFQSVLSRPAPAPFVPGAMIGRYEVRRMLGTGAFAVVYLAWDAQLDREVAIKVPHRFLLSSPAARQRFLDEARTVAGVRHPGIVTLFDVATLPDDGTIYLVMQYVAGDSLRKRLRSGPLPPRQASQIAAGVADAMTAAHRVGVFHRDLKPTNILLDENEQPHVCDFGLAIHVDRQRERRGEQAGTLAYMAPEQIRGESHQLDGRADIWALGVIHYEMLTGKVPFEGRNRDELRNEILHRDPRPPRQVDSRIPRQQERICLECLGKQPSQRPTTAGDVSAALRTLHREKQRSGLVSLLVLLLVASVFWIALAAAALWLPSRFGNPSTTVPLKAQMDLLVWDPEHPGRQGVSATSPQALPLRGGDQVRLCLQLNQPAHVYLLWLNADGSILPVYPWRHGKWRQRPQQESPRLYLTLPDKLDHGWAMQVDEDGLESLLLLVRRSPLPRDVNLQELLAPVSQPLPAKTSVATWFQDGMPLPVSQQPDTTTLRPPDLGNLAGIQDPLLKMHRRLAEVLRPHFKLIRAVSFPVKKGHENTKASMPDLEQ
ncbi:MAG: protein kinase [Pirellulaceae bacterium]